MKNDVSNKFSPVTQRLYPHLKLTQERFPRLLVTRKILDDEAEYFGAFLPETGVRLLIDFLNKTFRLRTCEIDIDGSFDVPCTQFYRRRCVAPCVANLCNKKEYLEQVELVRLFLQRKTEALEKVYLKKIETTAERNEFELAADLRDEWQSIQKILTAKDWNFWLTDTVDTFEMTDTENEFLVYLVTMRGRKTLGKRTFVFEKSGTREEILIAILTEFYRFHAPKEIRVSEDFAGRSALANELSRSFNRRIKITVVPVNEPKIMTRRALNRTKYEYEFGLIRHVKPFSELTAELKSVFGLAKNPARIEGFDVAHISGSDFVAAKAVWEKGKFLGKEYSFWFSDEASELETLRRFIEFRFSPNQERLPDLILIDGGQAHLQAAMKGLENFPARKFGVISAVKPPGQHGEISHFLTERGKKINFEGVNETHRLLQTLRDEAHNLSNEIHRQRREMSHFYELAAMLPSINENERRQLLKTAGSLKDVAKLEANDLHVLFSPQKVNTIMLDLQHFRGGKVPKIEPLIVPLRYDDENGEAQDLRPLATYRNK